MEIKEAFGSCPRCGQGIDYRSDVTICSKCGWMPAHKEKQSGFAKRFAVFGVIAVLAFIQAINWGSYSLEIVPLKTKSVFGMASLDNLDRIAEICELQLKYDCAAEALSDKAWKTNESSDFQKLGDLRRRMNQWDKAIESYELAIARVSDEKENRSMLGDVYYGLAKSFHVSGEVAMAEDYYKKALRSKPGVLQVTVTTDYAMMLKNAGRANEAKQVIASAEKRSGAKGRFANLVDL